jgi:hypothetical protein
MAEQEPASLQITTPKRDMYWSGPRRPGYSLWFHVRSSKHITSRFRLTMQGSTGSGGGNLSVCSRQLPAEVARQLP